MSYEKRLWIVSLTTTGADGYISTSLFREITENDARDRLAAFKLRCIKEGNSHVASYSTEVSGKVMKPNPDYVETPVCDNILQKYIPTGGLYCGQMDSFTFDPDDLDDAEREYEIEMMVTRTNRLYITVKGMSEDEAEQKARDEVEDGDHESDLDSPDDFEIEIEAIEIV